MNAQIVYQVAKALPLEEQKALLEMLQSEFSADISKLNRLKKSVLTKEDAIQYLLKNVFDKK